MKRLAVCLLALFALAGCGGGGNNAAPASAPATTTQTQTPPPPKPAAQPPGVVLTVSPERVNLVPNRDDFVTVAWRSERASRVVSADFNAGGLLNGSQRVVISRSRSFTITVEGPGGKATASASVRGVVPVVKPKPNGGYTYVWPD